jgi:hypothetical protein
MTNITKVFILAVALSSTACGWRRTPVPVISDTGSAALLVGTWEGGYNSTETGRSGSISFELASEKDTAWCDVTMIPAVQNLRISTEPGAQLPAGRQAPLPEPLKVRFIRLGGGLITGTLEPYVDPDCSCTVSTTFEARFSGGNKIEGTYTTTGRDSRSSTNGKWKVTRKLIAAATE